MSVSSLTLRIKLCRADFPKGASHGWASGGCWAVCTVEDTLIWESVVRENAEYMPVTLLTICACASGVCLLFQKMHCGFAAVDLGRNLTVMGACARILCKIGLRAHCNARQGVIRKV